MSPSVSGPVLRYPSSATGRTLVRELITVPRLIPRDVREDLVSIMVLELIEGVHLQIRDSQKFRERYGIFYPILIHLRHSPLWHAVQDLARDSPETAAGAARVFITTILDLIDRVPVPTRGMYADLDEEVRAFLASCEQSCEEVLVPDDLSSLIAEFSDLLSRVTSGELQSPQSLEPFCEACLATIQHYKDAIAVEDESQSVPDSEKMQDLIVEFQQAIDDLQDEPGSYHGDSTGTGTGSPQNGPGGKGEGSGQGSDTARALSLIRQIRELLLEQKRQPAGMPEMQSDFFQPKDEASRFQSILQKAVMDPASSLLQSLDPHRRSIRFLSEVHPGTDWGLDITSLKTAEIENLESYAAYAEKNQELKRIIRCIGRVSYDAGILSHGISPMSRSEMYSITRSRDIARLLPVEAVKISHSVLKTKFYADFTEGKLLTYDLRGFSLAGGRPKKKKHGPVVALVDTSGSMNGFPETVAKSIILALATRMMREERDVKVILFSGPGDTREIELSPKRKMGDEFLSFLQKTFGGGTDFTTALYSGLESLRQPAFRGADLLFLTDGVSEISNRAVISEWIRVKEKQDARVFSCIIGGTDPGGLAPISDYTYFIQDDPEMMLRIVPSPDNPKERTYS